MSKAAGWLILLAILSVLLMSIGPTLAALFHGLVPVVLVVGLVAVVMRLAWWFTGRW